MNRYIGIDPGATGGIALLVGDELYVTKMPNDDDRLVTCQAIFTWINRAALDPEETYCDIELVGGFVGGPAPGSRMFNFGKTAGWIDMAVVAAEIPTSRIKYIQPRSWQKFLGIEQRRFTRDDKNKKIYTESQAHFKIRLVDIAKLAFPKKTTMIASHADASLIALSLKHRIEGTVPCLPQSPAVSTADGPNNPWIEDTDDGDGNSE